ncbi:hypothetical protein P0D88_08660 [Paraburkholderia sp. RL18-103-BIB-C]|jgi:hypothetical protein|uniref:DUF6900 domain-containing protein n=1 Tax=unclassified Paraburkholderia TaxID=2615204 RepID=UPI0038BCCE22
MIETPRKKGDWDPLAAIANEELGIRSFAESGKVTTDIRLVRISSVAKALERAYDFGVLMGHAVNRAEHPNTKGSKLTCRSDQDWVRAVANDILSTYLR